MPARSIASLSLSFGLVSIPVKLYSATESEAAVKFNYICQDGSRAKQQFISEKTGKPVERADLQKGCEFEKDKFVVFSSDELKALEEGASHIVGNRGIHPSDDHRPDLLRQGLLHRSGQARRQAIQLAQTSHVREPSVRVGQVGFKGQISRRTDSSHRRRPDFSAIAFRRRSTVIEGPAHRAS